MEKKIKKKIKKNKKKKIMVVLETVAKIKDLCVFSLSLD